MWISPFAVMIMYQKIERKDIESYEAVTLNNLSGRFLKDGVKLLAKLISGRHNLLIWSFLKCVESSKAKTLYLKKARNVTHPTRGFFFSPRYFCDH